MTSPLGTGVVSIFPVNAGLAPNIDPLLVWGYRWGNGPVGAPATVTYSFPAAGATWIGDYWDNEPFVGFSAFNAAQQTVAKQALAAWSEVANITFVQVADTPTNVGDIRFANSNVVAQAGSSAWAYLPYATQSFAYPEAGDIWFNPAYPPNFQLQPGQFGYSTMIHEIGHAIGLDHPFADPGNPGEIALPPNLDNESYTIMSYTINDTTLAYSSSPMLFDILAIQYIYGANMTTRTGNDVYRYSATVEIQKTIWDAGGIDTLDFSNQTKASTIDLHAGTFTRFGGTTPTTSSLVAIAYGVTIENAIGGSAGDYMLGNDAANTLDGRGGADMMYGGAGNDIYVIDNIGDVVDEGVNNDTGDELRSANILLSQRFGIENYTYTGAAAWKFTAAAGLDNRLSGGSGGDTLNGGDGNDTLLGNGGNDVLIGLMGDEILDGGAGLDRLRGGGGNDVYVIDNAGDIIDETGNVDADDEVRSAISFNLATLGAGAIEHGLLLGTAALNATGNGAENDLTGNDGANILDGAGGADILDGGKGNDTYIVDDAGDQVIEALSGAAGGTDLVKSTVSFSLASSGNVENLTLLGAATDATGNALANVLTGNDGNNILDGGGGADTLIGGKGDDTYIVNATSDVISETIANNLGGGIDTVESSATFNLTAGGNVDNLTLTGGSAINGTGNALNNLINGNGAANILDGGGGADVMKGGAGNDVYVVDHVGDVVDEEANTDLADEVRTSFLITVGLTGIENYSYTGTGNWKFTAAAGLDNRLGGGSGSDTLNGGDGNDTLSGNGGNDVLIGMAGDDILDGGAGLDKLRGGGGNDIYVINNAGDIIDETGNVDAGDEVRSTISFNLATLGAGAIEHGVLLGTAALNATGGGASNNLTGNDGANILDGAGGADILDGGKGSDTYIVDDAGDQVIETLSGATGGTDLVKSSLSFSLASLGNVENLTLLGAATNATGNALANVLTGNDGNNILDGGGGADILVGGKGDDIYVVNSVSDVISETIANNVGGGIDGVESSATFSLAALGNVENLTLTGGGAINGTGNALINIITGNGAANILDGGSGADILKGGAGNDVYIVDNAGDVVDEEANTDLGDEVRTGFLIAANMAGIENYTYTGTGSWKFTAAAGLDNKLSGGSGGDTLNGGDGNDTLLGNGGNDVLIGLMGDDILDGGIGLDRLRGGGGNDVYVIDNAGDIIDETGNVDADDEVRSTISFNLATLGTGAIEHGLLLGTAALNATGNGADNNLTGNDGANILDGAGGADILDGGKGNDTYIVDDAGDQVIEALGTAAGGIDLVKSSVSFSLASSGNVENLTLTGSANVDATGNALANVLTGNDGNNILDGGGGADTLIGGKGDDTYILDAAGDVVSETISNAAGGGVDTVVSNMTFSIAGFANLDNVTLAGGANVNATGNASSNVLIGNGGLNTLDGGGGADVLKGGAGNDVYVLDNIGDVVDEEGNTDLDDWVKTSAVIAAGFTGVEHYTYTGAAAWAFTGTSEDNEISGGIGNDTLNGDDGNDNLLGNGGNDTLIGGIGNDWLEGGAGNDKLRGGAGDDTYVIDDAGDTIDEEGNNDANDVVRAAVSVNLAAIGGSKIESVVLLGASAIDATGNDQINTLAGNDAANILDGGASADVLIGGKGNDTYVIDTFADQVTEDANGGVDTVKAGFTLALASFTNIENLTLSGSSNIDATGNAGANVLTGNEGSNVLDGGGGIDTLIGGKGDDTYIVDDSKATIIETISNALGGGIDTVISKEDFSIENMANLDNVTITGDKFGGMTARGNSSANILTYTGTGYADLNGRGGDDRLIGGDGGDFLTGGDGNDYLLGGGGSDHISGGTGIDTIDYNHISGSRDTIDDFKLGAGGDILDLHDLLIDVGYSGTDPFGDAYLSYTYTPNAWSQLYLDADGKGSGSAPVEIALLFFTDLGQATADNYIL